MQNEFNTKNAFHITPCGPIESCFDYDDCESGDDITEKDLEFLLKEEKKKLQNANEKTENNIEENKDATKAKDLNKVQEKKTEDQDRKKNADQERRKEEELERRKEEDQRGKKRTCKKVIKNPFFTNRLTFSTDMPPRPPVPPPQFFPPADEDSSKIKICPKRKRKCDKRKELGAHSDGKDMDDKDLLEKGFLDDTKGEPHGKGFEADSLKGNEIDGDQTEESQECVCDEKPDQYRERRPCSRGMHKNKIPSPPCRKKKDSNTSIPPQPRRIPALLKDLPLTCPKNIPEVEKQIWMARDNNWKKGDCSKKRKTREEIEKIL